MKRLLHCFFCVMIVCSSFFNDSVLAMNEDDVYVDFKNNLSKYDSSEFNVSDDSSLKSSDFPMVIVSKIKKFFLIEIKNSWIMFLKIIIICFISSLIRIYVTDNSFADISFYGCYCIISYIMIDNFKMISTLCSENIANITDFITVTVPAFASCLAMSGYVTQATSSQGIFLGVALFITQIIVKFIIPLLFCCGMIAVISNISTVFNLSKFVTLISKAVKYSMGVLTIIFAGIITFSGFSNASIDNMSIKTAKYAVANFVPVVGGCLSEALHSVINSSVVLKNSMGYMCFITLISLCLLPVIKIAVVIFTFRITSTASETFCDSKIGDMINSVTDVLSTMLGLLLLTIVIFVLIIGVIVSTG